MDSPNVNSSPAMSLGSLNHGLPSQSSRSRSSTKLGDDVTDVNSLTSFNPFSEEDENDHTSYTLVTSLFSRMKNTLSAPLQSTVTVTNSSATSNLGAPPAGPSPSSDQRRPSYSATQTQSSYTSVKSTDRPLPLVTAPGQAAPPLVSLTPARSELPSFTTEYDTPSRKGSFYLPGVDPGENLPFGTSIPGFPIQDDARSIKTSVSLHRSGSVSKVMRRIRGEGLSRDYWMDDENCKECYDCKSVFTAWRRKHHCRICGQIFCSRCASNIIKGARFGHDGMVRVCNLCLEKLAQVDDDEDDRRSVVSSVTSAFPAHQLGNDTVASLGYHPQSPFAASQLFGRTDEPFNLYSIAETHRPMYGSDSFPITPHLREREDGVWEPVRDNPAPFRRTVTDDDKVVDDITTFGQEGSPSTSGSKPNIQVSVTKPITIQNSTSSIQFPVGSPDFLDSPRALSKSRPVVTPYGDLEIANPFIRSRAPSQYDSIVNGEPAWRTRRESTAYAQELNLTSMLHLKTMLRQMLTSEQIPNIKDWEEALLRMALRIAREMTYTALPHRQGEDMDVRRYVKIKKIPGGTPKDSEYVNGVVITKNVAHKQMLRLINNPRVMLVTFPLEFHRVEGQYMHFGQIVRQEKEYLGNLASRIAALRPHVVLVEKSVSRLALDALVQHNIAVARTVKSSAIKTVARMTQGDIFSSMDKLALEPRLGHCGKFRIQTYDHPLIPGRRKTYMRFEGCNRDMGCTLILRGADIETLRRVKKVTKFLIFIVRNLRLETNLWRDSVITLPQFNPDATPVSLNVRLNLSSSSFPITVSTSTTRVAEPVSESQSTFYEPDTEHEDLPDEEAEQRRLTRRIDESVEPYTKTFISVSATLRFPLPYPILRMKELDNELLAAKMAWEDDIVRKEERLQASNNQKIVSSTPSPSTATPQPIIHATGRPEDNEREDINALIEALPTLDIPGTPEPGDSFTLSGKVDDASPYFAGTSLGAPIASSATTIGPIANSPLVEEPVAPIKTAADIYLESRYKHIKWLHEEHRRIWEWYLRKNRDDFVVEKYQRISLWEYTIPTAEVGQVRACFAPRLNYITFYGENDMTLGQFIEKSVGDTLVQFLDPKAICTGKGCDQPLARHSKVFVHNETRLFVAVEQWDGQIVGHPTHPMPDLITTWSACRICGSATPFIPVSEEMQRYSFAKFLELHFYPADVRLVQGAGCEHNIYQHHIRYFAVKGMTLRFQGDPVPMHEVVYPPFRIRVRPETQLELKNSDFKRLHHRNTEWYTGLINDLRLISVDAATGDDETDSRLRNDINNLISRAQREKEDIARLINRIYNESSPTDTLALNQVHAYTQDNMVAWQQDFDKLPKVRFPQTIDRNSKRVSAFTSVRAIWPRRYDLPGTFDSPQLPSSTVSEAEEGSVKTRRLTGDSFTSSASETSEPETNTDSNFNQLMSNSVDDVSSTGAECDSNSAKDLRSDPESDSTVGAPREANEVSENQPEQNPDGGGLELTLPLRTSKLPRRSNQPSVAELVKKYQDYLPREGIQELAKGAFPHQMMSESEQEYPVPVQRRQPTKSRGRHHIPARKASTSDFEQGYAANVAPRYLTHARRTGTTLANSKIPAPIGTYSDMFESEASRRPSPEKLEKRIMERLKEVRFSRPPSPHGRSAQTYKMAKNKTPTRQKDKTATRPPPRRPPSLTGGRVSNIAKQFERIGRDAERSNRFQFSVLRGKRFRPVASARAKVEVLDSIKDAIKDESESSDSSSEADDEGDGNDGDRPASTTIERSSGEFQPDSPEVSIKTAPPITSFRENIVDSPSAPDAEIQTQPPPGHISLPPSPFLSSMKAKDMNLTPPNSDLELGPASNEFQRNSILKALSGFWLQPTRHPEGDDPLNDPEHIFRDSSMVVRIDEPTSIIALALNSPQYREMLNRSHAEKRTAREAKFTEASEVFMPDDRSSAESGSTWGVVNVDSDEFMDPAEDIRVPSSKSPWAISFESGGLTISCTVLYPEQFDALRRTYDCEKSMVESLARCVKWNAGGGKSGSAFLKTRDDRFIAKELSRAELQTMETFAPAYFDYMSSAYSANRPTLLAKVFGCYKLTFRKTGKDRGHGKPKATQMNLLVMENLFYDRRFTKIYDLKGSTRNRHVQSTGRENEVLLDENLVETAHLNPFYLREHSKRILRGALYNDSKFLADINVMDYSLVCGVDSQNNELVVGIVDYIRTYTWDKKLESWVKESTFLGGPGRGEPTIVTPKQYRQRFISAMERYFPLIPDRWMKQKDAPEEDSNCLSELWPDW